MRALLCLFLLAPAAAADGKKPTLHLSGSHDDAGLAAKAPAAGVVTTAKGLADLAAAWGLKGLPAVDFATEVVVVATTRGGKLTLEPVVADGDLKAYGIATRDLRPGFRYALVAVPRAGVKTVNGKPLPKD